MECPDPMEIRCISDLPQADPESVISVDNCGLVTVSHGGDISDGNTCPETISRSYLATDESGNITECTQIITVMDTIPPILSGVPEDVVVSCENIPEPPEVTAIDNCGNEGTVSLFYEEIANSVENCAGAIVRQWIATDQCGNSVMDYQTIIVESTTGIDEIIDPAEIRVYPNPTDGIIVISGLSEQVRVDIFSVHGVLLISDNNVDSKIDISGFKPGIYFLKIMYSNGQMVRKTIVRR
jgi:hypothetical protein